MRPRELRRRVRLLTRDLWIGEAVAGAIGSREAASLAANGSL